MGIADGVLEAIGLGQFDGGAFSLVGRRLRAEIGWYVGVGSSAGVLIWDMDSDGRLSATTGRSAFDQNFDRQVRTNDRFWAMNLCSSSARLGHDPPISLAPKLKFEALLHTETCRTANERG